VAAWQASFRVVLPSGALPSDYAERLGRVLPLGEHWDAATEMWGAEDGDSIEVSAEPTPKILARFDLRTWRPDLYERFVAFVQGVGGRLDDADQDVEVSPTSETFMASLRGSRAARFVKDPLAYLEELRRNPIRFPEEP
jgi:hypothetical protein